MNREQALEALQNGNKLTHTYFLEGEFIQLNLKNGNIETEDGFDFTERFKTNPELNKGWSIIE